MAWSNRRTPTTRRTLPISRKVDGQPGSHAASNKVVGHAVNSAFRGTSCTSAVGGRFAKDDDRPAQFVDDLFGPFEAALACCPVVRSRVHDTLRLGMAPSAIYRCAQLSAGAKSAIISG